MSAIEFDNKSLANEYYDYQYKGCLNKVFCSCFKSYMHKRRHQNVLKEYDEFKNKANAEDLQEIPLTLIMEPVTRMISLYSLMSNFTLILKTYWIAVEPQNIQKVHYKIVVII
jgi:hypothetical protein